jgi:hypothetical protein
MIPEDEDGIYSSPCGLGDGAPLKDKIDQLKSIGIATFVSAPVGHECQ